MIIFLNSEKGNKPEYATVISSIEGIFIFLSNFIVASIGSLVFL